jgi:hypothetical protein
MLCGLYFVGGGCRGVWRFHEPPSTVYSGERGVSLGSVYFIVSVSGGLIVSGKSL